MSFKEIHTLYSETVSESPWSPVPSCCPSPVLRIYWFCNLTSSEYIYLMSNSVRKKKKIAFTLLAIWHDSVEERQKKSEDNTADPWTTLSLGLQNPSNPWAVKNSFITSSFITSCVHYFLSSAIHIHGSTSRFNQPRIQPTMDLVVL